MVVIFKWFRIEMKLQFAKNYVIIAVKLKKWGDMMRKKDFPACSVTAMV